MQMPAAAASERARIVMWELTRACKLTCVHCPIGAQQRRSPLELSTYEAYKTIDQIVALSPEEVIITGGDPLERGDIYQLIDYARRRGLQPSLTVSATPGLTGAAVGKLKRNGLTRLVVSVDSAVPERHDLARGISGQFASTLMALRWARTSGLVLEINTLVTRNNEADLDTIAELLADLGVSRWNVHFVVPIGDSKGIETLDAAEVETAFAKLQEIASRAPFAVRAVEAPHYRRFLLQRAVEANQRSIEKFFDGSGDGIEHIAGQRATNDRSEFLFISHTGEVSISAFLPMTAGNVRYQPLSSLYRYGEMFAALRDDANLKGKCGRCEFKRTCGGSRARAFAMTGDIFASDPLCAYEPGTFDTATATIVRREETGVLR